MSRPFDATRPPMVRGSVPSHVALLGLPRSGTSWMANLLAAHHAVSLVNEPDNPDLDLLGWLGPGVLGVVPVLAPGERARDYRSMWRVAFAGGWPTDGGLAAPTTALRRLAGREPIPRLARATALRAAAALAAHRRPAAP